MLKVELIGNLGADAEVKAVNGSEFISMNIAHNEKRGEIEKTIWCSVSLPIVYKNALPYLKKGARVFVRGDLGLRVYSSSVSRQYEAGVNIYAKEMEICLYATEGGNNDGKE